MCLFVCLVFLSILQYPFPLGFGVYQEFPPVGGGGARSGGSVDDAGVCTEVAGHR